MPNVVVFETNSEILAEIGDCLAGNELLEQVELQLVFPSTPIEAVLARTRPLLVITSWRDIGCRVVTAVQAIDPRPAVWVMSNYPSERVVAEAPARVDHILDKYDTLGGDFAGKVRLFLETGRLE